MAASCGPSAVEASSQSMDGSAYSQQVRLRASTVFPGHWDERVRLYREGLALDTWSPDHASLPLGKKAGVPVSQVKNFRCPVSVIFGMRDVALDPRIAIAGIQEHFNATQRGEVISDRVLKLPDCGHWCMLEPDGIAAIEKTVRKAIAG